MSEYPFSNEPSLNERVSSLLSMEDRFEEDIFPKKIYKSNKLDNLIKKSKRG